MKNLENKSIAVLMTDGFEEIEFTSPYEALEKAGAKVSVISNKPDEVKAWDKTDWGKSYNVDVELQYANADHYDGLLLPGGVLNPDQLRKNKQAVEFVTSFFEQGKPIAAICHAPQLLIETEALKDREITSYPSIKTDLINAGAKWLDQEVVVDSGLTTSRSPEDLEAFNAKMIEEFAEGVHEEQMTV